MSSAEHEMSVSCHIAAPRAICWKVWTDLKDEWFCPKPWRAEVIEAGAPRVLEFGVADETAWRAGLSCGGRIRVFVERVD